MLVKKLTTFENKPLNFVIELSDNEINTIAEMLDEWLCDPTNSERVGDYQELACQIIDAC